MTPTDNGMRHEPRGASEELDVDLIGAPFFCWRRADEPRAAYVARVLACIDEELVSLEQHRIEPEELHESISARLAG